MIFNFDINLIIFLLVLKLIIYFSKCYYIIHIYIISHINF